jgi:hypothetical protein
MDMKFVISTKVKTLGDRIRNDICGEEAGIRDLLIGLEEK